MMNIVNKESMNTGEDDENVKIPLQSSQREKSMHLDLTKKLEFSWRKGRMCKPYITKMSLFRCSWCHKVGHVWRVYPYLDKKKF